MFLICQLFFIVLIPNVKLNFSKALHDYIAEKQRNIITKVSFYDIATNNTIILYLFKNIVKFLDKQ